MRRLVFLTLFLALVSSAHAMIVAGPRAQVSRVRAEMRSVATALEAYRIDQGSYPPSSASPEWQMPSGVLTTPIAYVDFEAVDPFKRTHFTPAGFPLLRHAMSLIVVWGLLFVLTSALAFVLCAAVRWSLLIEQPLDAMMNRVTRHLAWVTALLALILLFLIPRHGARVDSNPNMSWTDRPQGFLYWTDGTESWLLQSLGPDGDRDLEDLSAVDLSGRAEDAVSRLAPFTYDPTNGLASSGDIFRVAE